MSILAVGSVAFDTIKTPFGEVTDIVGGSLTYFALSASFFTDVNLVAVVGEDFGEDQLKLFRGRRIDLQGVAHAQGKTFRWGGEYSLNLNCRIARLPQVPLARQSTPQHACAAYPRA